MPDLQAIHFTGDFIDDIRQRISTGLLGSRAATMSKESTTMLEKFTAVVDDDPSFSHYTFLKN